MSDTSMMLVTSAWGPTPSFSLFPTKTSCPYVEALYNPQAKTLAIIGKSKKETFHMLPRLSDDGTPIQIKSGEYAGQNKKQRVQQDSYSEYYITERSEIEAFIAKFADNHMAFDFKKTLDMPTMEDPSKSGIEQPSMIIT